MFCRKCGRYIYEEDSDLCYECKDERYSTNTQDYDPYNNANNTPKGNRMKGFGRALTGVILSEIAAVIVSVLVEIMELQPSIELAVFGLLLSLGVGIPAIIIGAKSIGLFKEMSNSGMVKPIPTLILGIIGLVSGIGLAIIAMAFMLILTAF